MITKKILQLKQNERRTLLFDYSLYSKEELEEKYKISFKELKYIYAYSKRRITNTQKEILENLIKLIKEDKEELNEAISKYKKLFKKTLAI